MCIRIVVVACVDVVLPFASVGGLRSGAVSLSLVMLTHLEIVRLSCNTGMRLSSHVWSQKGLS